MAEYFRLCPINLLHLDFMKENKEQYSYIPIEEELKKSYLTYAMSVIVSRALPDVRDGLKPSQRRILVAMNDLNLGPNAKFRKCAKIAGDTSGNYHPHGEMVIYPTLVRMAQPFNMRYPLINGQGNFGSLDGDPPAAMRYTESKMKHPSMELMDDLEKDTVDFTPNYDETRTEPVVLPSKFPNLLANGSVGIAVGMSTSIPPHNIQEICDGIVEVIDNPNITPFEMCQIIKGPDFPTGATICGKRAIEKAYCGGRGTVTVRANYEFEEMKKGKMKIVFTEIPYQLNKANIIEKIADLVKDGKLKGITDVRDESDRKHAVRIVVELKKGENEEVILNQIFKYTYLQCSYSIIMIALVDNRPKLLNIKEMVQYFVNHRQEVIRRRTNFLLRKAEKRAHIVDGLILATQHIDEIIKIIRNADNVDEAKATLIAQFDFSQAQTDAVLQMRLGTLTKLEFGKLDEERKILAEKIERFKTILGDEQEVLNIIKKETFAIKERYGDKRRTQIGQSIDRIDIEDIIPDDNWAVLITNNGYIKRMQIELYKKQNRGGSGVSGASVSEDDFVEKLFTASAHQYILCFSNLGKVYWLKVYDIPESSRIAKGRAIVNLLNLDDGENITSVIPVSQFDERLLMMATAKGVVKKTILSAFARPNKGGIRAIHLDDGDSLIGTKLTKGSQDILLATAFGKACRFNEKDVRSMGRAARGVRGCRLAQDDEVIGMEVVKPGEDLLTITENGYGKRSSYDEYRVTRRGAQGVRNLKRTAKTGNVVAIRSVTEKDEIMVITTKGMVIRMDASIRLISRATQGVKVIRLKNDDTVTSVAKLAEDLLETLVEEEKTPPDQTDETKTLEESNIQSENEEQKQEVTQETSNTEKASITE